MSEFARYIGLPWERGAQGPDSFDCGGFLRFLRKEHFNADMPVAEVDPDDLRATVRHICSRTGGRWQSVGYPAHGDVVLMAHAKYPSHVGMWIDVDGGLVIHCVRGSGVIASSLFDLRLAGWGKIEFYRDTLCSREPII